MDWPWRNSSSWTLSHSTTVTPLMRSARVCPHASLWNRCILVIVLCDCRRLQTHTIRSRAIDGLDTPSRPAQAPESWYPMSDPRQPESQENHVFTFHQRLSSGNPASPPRIRRILLRQYHQSYQDWKGEKRLRMDFLVSNLP